MGYSGRAVCLRTRCWKSERQFTLDQARKLVPWLQETLDGPAPLRDGIISRGAVPEGLRGGTTDERRDS